jgi:hypothetical protein
MIPRWSKYLAEVMIERSYLFGLWSRKAGRDEGEMDQDETERGRLVLVSIGRLSANRASPLAIFVDGAWRHGKKAGRTPGRPLLE